MRRLPVLLLAGAAAVGLLTACEALVANAAMDFSITLEPSEVEAYPGQVFTVQVTVSRPVPIDVLPTPVVVALHDGPDFLSAEDLEIPSGISEDEMTFVVSKDAQIGETEKNVKVRATNGFKTKEVTFALTIVAEE